MRKVDVIIEADEVPVLEGSQPRVIGVPRTNGNGIFSHCLCDSEEQADEIVSKAKSKATKIKKKADLLEVTEDCRNGEEALHVFGTLRVDSETTEE